MRNICPSSMADSYPRFTTRANSGMCRNNYSTNIRFVGKLLFFAFFLIAIPSFPSQAPDFINKTIFSEFWELLHLMFIGIAVSYGLFCRRSVDNGSHDDTQPCVSGMFHVSSIFEDGFSNSLYHSGQGNAGIFNVKNGGFGNTCEEHVVQTWSSKYFQREPMVVSAQPSCGLEKYGESSSFVDYKPLGLPVRSLRSRVASRASPEFNNGSSESSSSHMKDSLHGSSKTRDMGFGGFDSEHLEVKLNENDVLGPSIPRRSRSGRRESVRSNVKFEGFGNGSSESSSSQKDLLDGSCTTRERGSGDLGSTNLEKFNESDVLGSSFPQHSRSGRSERVHSNVTFEEFGNGSIESSGSHMKDSSDSSNKTGDGGFGDLGSENLEKFRERDVLGSPIPRRSRSRRMRERIHSTVTYEGFGNGSSASSGSQMKDLSDSSNKSISRGVGDLGSEILEGKFDESDVLGSPIPWQSRSRRMRERIRSDVTYEGFGNGSSESSDSQMKDLSDGSNNSIGRGVGDLSSENLERKFDESDVLGSPIAWPSRSVRMRDRVHSNGNHPSHSRSGRMRERVHGNGTHPSHFRPLSVDETQFESLKSRSLRSTVSFSSQVSSQSQSPSSLSPSHYSSSESPKSKTSELVKETSPRQFFPPSPPVPKPTSSKASVNASHSQQYSDGSLLGTPARKCFKDELKELCDSKKDESLGSKEQISGSCKLDAKPAAPSKASLRGKSVRTFRTSRASANTTSARDAEEKREDYTKGKLRMRSDEIKEAYMGETEPKIEGLNRQILGGDSPMPKPTPPENPAAEPGEDSERENENFQISSDVETMSGTFSIAGSEVDRKAGEFIAKFREQIRLQRTSSVDTQRGLNMSGQYFR
ncbi:hypothetical protein V6N13_022148 [Hibiscus sabdariffa]|uniref:Uncharacterized protein n=2 Tax=Hibiscus sabdariffa TaxID=183260 RepID=A0ABR2CT34_9ROSI